MDRREESFGRSPAREFVARSSGQGGSAAGATAVGRWFVLAALALGVASNGCRKPQPEEDWSPIDREPTTPAPNRPAPAAPVPSSPAPSASTPPRPLAAPSGSDTAPRAAATGAAAVTEVPPQSEGAVLEISGRRVPINKDVALRIRTELSAQIEKSKLPHKQELLEQTRDAPILFSPDLVRFGLWILSAQGDHAQLIFRQPTDAPVSNFYQAEVYNRAGQWQVENLRVMSMRRR
jgi:hypothetical protein